MSEDPKARSIPRPTRYLREEFLNLLPTKKPKPARGSQEEWEALSKKKLEELEIKSEIFEIDTDEVGNLADILGVEDKECKCTLDEILRVSNPATGGRCGRCGGK